MIELDCYMPNSETQAVRIYGPRTPKPLKAHVKHIKPVKGDGPVTRLRKKRMLNVLADLMWSKANA